MVSTTDWKLQPLSNRCNPVSIELVLFTTDGYVDPTYDVVVTVIVRFVDISMIVWESDWSVIDKIEKWIS